MPHQKEVQSQPTETGANNTLADQKNDNSLPIISMVLGIVSLTGPGLILGIPAIILASLALKKKHGNQGMSITGLVSGIISTVVSLFFIVLLGIIILSNLSNPANPINHPGREVPLQRDSSSYDSQSY